MDLFCSKVEILSTSIDPEGGNRDCVEQHLTLRSSQRGVSEAGHLVGKPKISALLEELQVGY